MSRVLICFSLFAALSVSMYSTADVPQLVLATGGVTGVYYPAGGSICRMVNRLRAEHRIRCLVESTDGSVYNLKKLRERDVNFAVVQSDWQFHAMQGNRDFAGVGADKTLRSVFALHSEAFTVVARADAGIRSFADLKDKRVNIGNEGSGQRATMTWLMGKLDWNFDVFKSVHDLNSADQAKGLCDNKFDAFVFVAGYPNSAIKQATTECESVLVEVKGEKIKQAIRDSPYYRMQDIPGGIYRGNDEPIKTFGVDATLVTSGDVNNKLVYQLVRSVFENFESFRKLHPALRTLDKRRMTKAGLSAPLHEGAIQYFKEADLM